MTACVSAVLPSGMPMKWHGVLRGDGDGQRLRDRRCRRPRRRSGRAGARCRAGPRRPRASARASRRRRPGRCCASTCAGPRSGCSAPRRSCRTAAPAARSTAAGTPRRRAGDAVHRPARRPPRTRAGSARRARRRWRTARWRQRRPRRDVERLGRRARGRRRPSARRRIDQRCRPRSSGFSTNTWDRESSGALTSNDGFSVVAPMSTMSPASTRGRNASCWALLKRWISSTNRIVRRPERGAGRARPRPSPP